VSKPSTHFDVVVMGAGIAGLVSALRAAELELNVVVLERGKPDNYLCNTRLTSGIFHCAMQSASLPVQKLNEKILSNTSDFADPDLARVVSEQAMSSIRWLQSQGARFIKGAMPHYEYILSPPTLFHQNEGWRNKGGDVLLNLLEQKLLTFGAHLLRNHKVTSITQQQENSYVVEAETEDGNKYHFNTSNVVIADGGYQSNESLLKHGVSNQPQKLFQRNAQQSLGDGLNFAQSLGAQVDLKQGFYGHLLSRDAFTNDQLWPNPWMDPLATAGILVNSKGIRIADEGFGGIYLANELARSTDPLDAFIIVDENAWNTRGRINMQSPNPKLIDVGGIHFCSNSLIDLAQQAGIDANALQSTIQAHNEAILTGDFSHLIPTRTLGPQTPLPISGKMYYAFPVCAGITYTFGGIKTNAKGQVLNEKDLSIPGLFAVGSCTSGLEGGKSFGYVGGLIKAAVMGMQTAQTIKNHTTHCDQDEPTTTN
jgi:fumarate reductase flavoprotein subunit